jgi:hypothetical protein
VSSQKRTCHVPYSTRCRCRRSARATSRTPSPMSALRSLPAQMPPPSPPRAAPAPPSIAPKSRVAHATKLMFWWLRLHAVSACASVRACVRARVRACARACVRACVCTIHTRTHTHPHTHTHTHSHTLTLTPPLIGERGSAAATVTRLSRRAPNAVPPCPAPPTPPLDRSGAGSTPATIYPEPVLSLSAARGATAWSRSPCAVLQLSVAQPFSCPWRYCLASRSC